MTLSQKIKSVYPELTEEDFMSVINLQNDGNGDYIKAWNHPTLTQPTQEQLDAITE